MINFYKYTAWVWYKVRITLQFEIVLQAQDNEWMKNKCYKGQKETKLALFPDKWLSKEKM